MTREWYEELHKLLYDREKNLETLSEVKEINHMCEMFLQKYPFHEYPYSGYEALRFVCNNYEFETVLDVGFGEGYQSEAFIKEGKRVTAIDYGKSNRISKIEGKYDSEKFRMIIDDFNNFEFDSKFDVVWTSHVLEHQLNPHAFLKKIAACVHEGGVIAVTVPPYKSEIVGGHVSVWNPGLLLYRLILAGIDCSNAHVKKYGYNVSVVVRKVTISVLDKIGYDAGDLSVLKELFPKGIEFYDEYLKRDICFDGNIQQLNWE